MNVFRIFIKNNKKFSLQTVAGVKNVFTFALPTTTTYSNMKGKADKGNNKCTDQPAMAKHRSPSSLKD